MSILIEQTAEEAKLCLALVKRAEMERVRLVESRSQCLANRDEDFSDPVEFELKFKSLGAKCSGREMRVLTAFNFKIVRDRDSRQELILITCKFEAIYELASDYEPDLDQVEAFRKANGIFNSWPFFREYIQSTVTRMDFPPPPIPFLKLQLKRPEVPGSSTVSPSQETAAIESGTQRKRRARPRAKTGDN